jgi:AcrR family transcriptional regulator
MRAMHIHPRILRAQADALEGGPHFRTERERERHERIITIGRALMARHGSHAVTFANLAAALRISTTTLRRHFIDLHALLGEILTRHLAALSCALAEIPSDAPDHDRRKRQAYAAFTRTGLGGLTEAHLLLVRDRHFLPDDLLPQIEDARDAIGDTLAGANGREALLLLDEPTIPLPHIEPMLAALQPPAAPRQVNSVALPSPSPAIGSQPPQQTIPHARLVPAVPAAAPARGPPP